MFSPNTTKFACAIFLSIGHVASYALGSDASIPTPQEIKHDHKGSKWCRKLEGRPLDSNGNNHCQRAALRFKDEVKYTEYTSSTFTFSTLEEEHKVGCTVYMICDDATGYKDGMTGAQIKTAFNQLYAHEDVGTCGSIYLTNLCRITANACRDCIVVNGGSLAPPIENDAQPSKQA